MPIIHPSFSDGLVVSKALKERAAARIAGVQDLDLNAPPPLEEDDGEEEEGGPDKHGKTGKVGSGASGIRGAARQQSVGGAGGGGAGDATEVGPPGAVMPKKSLFDELDEEGVQEDPEKEVLAFEVLSDQVERV